MPISRSGSWFSNAASRRRAFIHTNPSGISAPITSEASESRPEEPAAVASRPSTMHEPALM